MTRPFLPTLSRFLPSVAGLVAFAVVLAALWVAPAANTANSETVEVEPTVASIYVAPNTPHKRTFNWEHTFMMEGDPDSLLVNPKLPYSISGRGGGNPGTSTLYTMMTFYINGEQAYKSQLGHLIGPAEGSGTTTVASHGAPGFVEEIDQSALVQGSNTLKVVVEVELEQESPGTQSFTYTMGPLLVETIQADGDHDGIVDAKQWAPSHTGLIALPVAVVAGGAVWFGGSRLRWWLLRRRTLPP